MKPPSLPDHDFDHGLIDAVEIGPRSELNLVILPLVWVGQRGNYGSPIRVRFGGIDNFEEVEAFFSDLSRRQADIASLRYDQNRKSKPGFLFFELVYERIDARLEVHCSSLQVTDTQSFIVNLFPGGDS